MTWPIYASEKNIPTIGSDNGLLPVRCQAIIRTNVAILSIRPYGTYFSEISLKIQKVSFTKMHLKRSSAKWQPLRLSLNMLSQQFVLHMFQITNPKSTENIVQGVGWRYSGEGAEKVHTAYSYRNSRNLNICTGTVPLTHWPLGDFNLSLGRQFSS